MQPPPVAVVLLLHHSKKYIEQNVTVVHFAQVPTLSHQQKTNVITQLNPLPALQTPNFLFV